MFRRTTLAAVLIAASGILHAQTAPAASTVAPASAAKKELVAKLLSLQQPGVEQLARTLVEQPALQLLQGAGAALQQRVAADKREAVGRELQGDVRKYIDETAPSVRDRAVKLMPTTIGPILEEKLTEDELRQVIAILESPANRKFQQLGGEMQKALVDRLVTETRPGVDTKVKALELTMARRLGITPAGSASSPAAVAPKK